MCKIIIMGYFHPVVDRLLASFKHVQVVYYIKDKSVSDDGAFEKFWEQYGAKPAELTEYYLGQVDLVFVCCYTKIIKSHLLDNFIFVNIHAGNLPKWRGFGGNSWSIINGDYHIAYTLHRVTEELDGGPIYKKFEYTLMAHEKYGDGRLVLEKMLANGLESVLCGISSGELKAKNQEGKYVYCSSFKKEDGYIVDWNIETRKILDLFKVFGAPYGSGLCFFCNGKKYEIIEIYLDEKYEDYYCIPGAIVNLSKTFVWIKTKDNVVKIGEIRNEEGEFVNPSSLFKIGKRL